MIHNLLQAARDASERAYVPYSHYPVGAALLGSNGVIYTGCNVENAAFPATICGERTALVKAVSEGQQEFTAIAVVTQNGGSPCGLCRQMLFEFAPELRVITANMDLDVVIDSRLDGLLQHGFGPKSLRP
ncbi:MAG: cytidine deaminase [Anaerolineaceae bacterium]|nr:cytidine deaminase [Anaerolineaceae bacterium]